MYSRRPGKLRTLLMLTQGLGLLIATQATWAATPQSCLDIKAAAPTAPDGTYVIYPNDHPFQVYCKGMEASTPAEYLPLAQTAAGQNFSQYTAGGASPGTNVVTSYTKVRLDPSTLLVNIGDQAFSTSTGSLYHAGTDLVTSMPYGTAFSCDGTDSGTANIDLRGTPFEVIDEFELGGAAPSGTTNKTYSDQVVSLTGGGFCGWNTSTADGGTYNPFNNAGTFQLNLGFVGYTSTGFLPPVAVAPAVNNGKAGQTYPIKWQITNSDGAYVSSLSAVQGIAYNSVNCTNLSDVSTSLTAISSGASSLRYDSSANQFVYNWSSPSTPGCYVLTVTLDTGQVLAADFKLR